MQKANTIRGHRREVLRERQRDVARRVGCSQATISRIERGELPEPWERSKYAKGYKLALEDFERLVRASCPVATEGQVAG